ncbi:hypothetical protein [Roseivirga thermotolerans]|uniref:hypothetical protein n=1 Tax=Roseivirga thermotolerans TaxID=1758176 RepID=UPI00273FEC74|nr:hypothetical protein [Roseivirga thermotolerans]
MKRSISVFLVLITLGPFALSTLNAQGHYPVGYRAIEWVDSLRQENSLHNYLKESPKQRYRKLLIHVWYPAIASTQPEYMSHKDYHWAVEEFLQQKVPDAASRTQQEERLLSSLPLTSARSLFEEKSLAIKNAHPIESAFPLLIHSGHVKAQWAFHEAMAQKGFIVLAVDGLDMPYQELSSVEDLLFGLRFITAHLGLKYKSLLGLGSGYGGAVIFALQQATGILDGIISFDGTETWKGSTKHFQELFPLHYQIQKLNIPYVMVHGPDTSRIDSSFQSTFRYANQYWIRLADSLATHGLFQYPHAINQYRSAHMAEASQHLLQLKVTLTEALNNSLNDTIMEPFGFIRKPDNLTHFPPLPPPLQKEEIVKLKEQLGWSGLKELLQTQLAKDAGFVSFDPLFLLGRDRTWTGQIEDGLPYLKLANELFPSRPGAYIELLKASYWLKDTKLNQQYLKHIESALEHSLIEDSPALRKLMERYSLGHQ